LNKVIFSAVLPDFNLTLYWSKDKDTLLLFHVDQWEASAIPRRLSTIRYEVFGTQGRALLNDPKVKAVLQ
jgi:hypothetical protein